MEKEIINIIENNNLDVNNLPKEFIDIFSNNCFDRYKIIIIKNALLYSIKNNINAFKNEMINNLNNLKKYINSNKNIKYKICEYGIKNILNNYYSNSNDSEIINKNYDNMRKIECSYSNIYSISNIYRLLLVNFVAYKNDDDFEIIYDSFFFSDIYDDEFIKLSSGFVTKDNILSYKRSLIRLMLTDVYLFIQSIIADDDLDYDNEILFKDYEDDESEQIIEDQELLDLIHNNVLKHIKKCIKNNAFCLPNDFENRLNIYAYFDTFNTEKFDDKTFFVNSLDNNQKLTLKKINPYYFIDLIEQDNK